MAHSDNILTKLHDLLLYLIPQLNKFPRDQKFVLGDRIETKLLEVQESCLRAYYGRDKLAHLLEANLRLELTRHLIRLAHGLRLFSNHTYGVLAEKVDEVGRMVGGWVKAINLPQRGSAGLQPAYTTQEPAMCSTKQTSNLSRQSDGQSRSQTGAPAR